jgi:hypothetical protein
MLPDDALSPWLFGRPCVGVVGTVRYTHRLSRQRRGSRGCFAACVQKCTLPPERPQSEQAVPKVMTRLNSREMAVMACDAKAAETERPS